MNDMSERAQQIAEIDHMVRQITWHGQKISLHTLSQPDIGLTIPQMVTLFAIRGAGTCRMSELAEATQQSAGTLTGIVDRLIDDNLVYRVRDSEDRRVVQVALTAEGERRLARAVDARHHDMERMLTLFSNIQINELQSLLHLMLDGMYTMSFVESARGELTNGHSHRQHLLASLPATNVLRESYTD